LGGDIALRCPACAGAGGTIPPLDAAGTAQRAVPTRFRGARRDSSQSSDGAAQQIVLVVVLVLAFSNDSFWISEDEDEDEDENLR
jgi:hypothetical protein